MKVLKVAAMVVGAVALVATGIGAIAGTGMFLGVAGSTFATIGTIAGVASAALGAAATLMTPKPGFGDPAPLGFQTNPQSGLPYPVGRTRLGGLKIFGATANSRGWAKDDLLFLGVLLSCAPIAAAPAFTADNVSISFDGSGQAVTSGYSSWMSQVISLGEMPQASALTLSLNGVSIPEWGSGHKLSGMAHALWGLRYDTDNKHYESGVPDPQWVGPWTLVYDPRLDSTYPGGSGSHRWDDESTHEWSRNGALIALKWARGHFANGKKVCGIGAPRETIRVADFVEAANVADANGWGCGGVEMTTDSKWDVLTRMLQAAGAVPTMTGAMIGCRVQTPRTSLCTIDGSELRDELVYAACKPQRDRINSVLPRYRSEAHDWEVITGSAVTVDDYVTEDGGLRTLGLDLPLVQAEVGISGYDGDLQAGQLAAYHICQGREATGEFTTGLKYIGVYSGDCVTLDAPSEGFDAVKILITGRSVDIASATIKFTFETETDGKHAFALGTSTTPPAAPSLTTPPQPIVTVPNGVNLLVNAAFDDGTTRGWTEGWDGTVALTVERGLNLTTGTDYFGQRNVAYATAIGTPAAGTLFDSYVSVGTGGATGLDNLKRFAIPVVEGESLYFSALLAGHRCDGAVICLFYDGLGALMGGDSVYSPRVLLDTKTFEFGDPDNAERVGAFCSVPAGARFAALVSRAYCDVGGSTNANPYLFSSEFFLAKVQAGQVVPPPYTPGPSDRAADVTGESADYLALLAEVTAIGSDGVLSKAEKPQLSREWTALYENWYALDAKATALSLGGSYQSNANTSVSALSTYLTGLSPAWTDVTADTAITAATFASKWTDAYEDVAALQAAIQGLPGADGDNGFTAAPASINIDIACSQGGTPLSGELPVSVTMKLLQGTTDLSDDGSTTYAVSMTGTGAAMGGTNNKVATFSAPMTADKATGEVTISRGGIAVAKVPVTINKRTPGPSGLSASTTSVSTPSGTSYGSANAGPLSILSSQDGRVYFDTDLLYLSGSASLTVVTGKFQYRTSTDGVTWGSWTDVAAETAGSGGDNVDAGELALTGQYVSNSGAPQFYQGQLLLKRNAVTTVSIGGTVSMWATP